MLKKQTIWLLTMLSLMIVLSVYYMTSPQGDELAFINNEDTTEVDETTAEPEDIDTGVKESESGKTDDSQAEGENTQAEDENTVVSQVSSDELFTSIRMQVQNERSMVKDQLEDVVASSSSSTEEKNEALNKMREIEKTATKESILEETIAAEANYNDVLIRAEEEVVHVTVKADELSHTEANNIIQKVYDEFGDIKVDVKYQPVS